MDNDSGWFWYVKLESLHAVAGFNSAPISYFDRLAREQICEKIAHNEKYDYTKLSYVLGATSSFCYLTVKQGLSVEEISDEVRFHWHFYCSCFNSFADTFYGYENFLSTKLDDERYDKVFSKEDFYS